MPYDPRMLQMARMGVNMMGPQAGPFDRAQQPKPWWDQPPPQSQARPDDSNPSGQPATQPQRPPGLYDMLLNLGKMTRPEYDKAINGPGAYGIAPKNAAMLGPWGFLGSLGLPGGAGWGGGGTPG